LTKINFIVENYYDRNKKRNLSLNLKINKNY